jgi:type II secretory pathway component PulF
MAVFAYTALDREGRRTSGTATAESRSAAMDQIFGRGLSPVAIEEQKSASAAAAEKVVAVSATTKVPQGAVETFTRELANLLAAGLPLSRALHLLRREASNAAARNVWSQVHDDVVSGIALADALARWPRTFSTVYVAMVRAGEAGGFLHVVLQQIADFRTREQDLKGKVKAALIYPCVLGVFACGVLIFLLTFFIPKFTSVFADFGGQLPWLTQMIVATSHVVTKYGWAVAIVIIFGVVTMKRSLSTESGRRFLERMMLKTPAIGKVTARFALVRFCRMLGTLVGGGVPLVSGLRTAKESLGNQTLADAVSHAIEEVQRGTSLSKSLSATPILFPPSVVEMVAVAEETGRLDTELLRLSLAYESELDRNLRMLVALAEPLMLFVTAVVIGIVVVGMLLPILTLQDVVH